MKATALFLTFFSIVFSLTNCQSKKKTDQAQGTKTITATTSYRLEQVWATESTLKTPESVIYDESRDVLYVSNVNENPWEKDDNGFISKVSTNGKILTLEWVSGFSGTKGMAIVDNTLFVADIDQIGLIDIEKGKVIEIIKIEGASGLNDITPDEKGGIFISDSNEEKIFHYTNGTVSVFHNDTPGRPNGLLVDQGNLLVAFSKASEFVAYHLESKEKSIIATEIGHGDGITLTNEANTYLVSDWSGEVFIITPSGSKQSLIKTIDQEIYAADIWFILEKNLVLVPTFFDNRVVAYKLIKE